MNVTKINVFKNHMINVTKSHDKRDKINVTKLHDERYKDKRLKIT